MADAFVLQLVVMRRDAVLNARIPSELKRALKRAAADDHGRSVSGMLARILDEWLQEHGYLGGRKAGPRMAPKRS